MRPRATLVLSLFVAGCSAVLGQSVATPEAPVKAEPQVAERVAEIPLIIVGEGGTSGYLFQYAADTYVKEHGGAKYTVHDGDEFVAAMREFANEHGAISRFVYMGHGNEVGLYVNQAPHINGALYANDPQLNQSFRAGSIYDLPTTLFGSGSTATFYGCNVARTREGFDSFAEQFANHFRTEVVAPIGPTEFSFSPTGKTSIPREASVITEPLYMIPTTDKKGFVQVLPAQVSAADYDDVYASMEAAAAIDELSRRGLAVDGSSSFAPYQSITHRDAKEFCRLINSRAACAIEGLGDEELVRNTAALKLLLDAAGIELKRGDQPYAAEISFANANGLLTPDFTRRRWYARAEMAMLTANVLRFLEAARD